MSSLAFAFASEGLTEQEAAAIPDRKERNAPKIISALDCKLNEGRVQLNRREGKPCRKRHL